MNKEKKLNQLETINLGAAKHPGPVWITLYSVLLAQGVSLERFAEREYDQSIAIIIVPLISLVASGVYFYFEGIRETWKKK